MPGYKKLGYVALNVSEVARARAFYAGVVGLEPSGEGEGGEAFFRCSADHHNLVLYPADAPGLKRIGLEMADDEALEALLQRLAKSGVAVETVEAAECRALHQGRSFRIAEPFTGATLEFYAAMRELSRPFQPSLAKIKRLGHVVLWVPDFDGACDFYTSMLGFRVSDVIDGQACFMRCHPNPYHHGIALIKGAAARLHHVNFMVTEIDDIGRAIARFGRDGVRIVYGPGRHPPSDSIFLYFLDPDGLTLEYSFGMEEFPEAQARKPRLFEPVRESYDYWSSFRDPERYARIGAIERLGRALAGAPAAPEQAR